MFQVLAWFISLIRNCAAYLLICECHCYFQLILALRLILVIWFVFHFLVLFLANSISILPFL